MVRIQSVQILRSIAALSVLALHATSSWEGAAGIYLGDSAHVGAFGVDLFFVISGFIVTRVACDADSAAGFFWRRFVRVAPVYYMHSVPWLFIAIVKGKSIILPLVVTLLFWPIWGDKPTFPLLSVGWTLCFEALFYSALTISIWLGNRAGLLMLGGYVVALFLNAGHLNSIFQFLGDPLFLEFLCGVAIASRPVRERQGAGIAAIVLGALWLGAWTFNGLRSAHNGWNAFEFVPMTERAVFAGPTALLWVWGALQFESRIRGRVASIATYIGDASYSIYLSHVIVVILLEYFWRVGRLPLLAMPFAEFVVGIACGVLAFHYLEKPLLAALRQKPTTVAVAT